MNTIIRRRLVLVLITGLFLAPSVFAQDDSTEDRTMDKLKKLLEDKSSGDEANTETENSEQLEALKEANRELHGGRSVESRQKQDPSKILDEIIEKMDTAARSLETNVRKLNAIRRKLKQLDLPDREKGNASGKQKQVLEQIQSLLDNSKDQQENASEQLKELLSFKKQLSRVQSSQKQSLSSIDKLLKIARQQSSSRRSGSGRKRRKQRKQSKGRKKRQSRGQKNQQANKPQQQKKNQDQNQNQPADQPYEASSKPPGEVKTHSTGSSASWGELPEKVREAIIQRRNEEFVPEYGERLRQYYRKLGEDSQRQ